MSEFLFNKIASFQGCNFIKKKLHRRCLEWIWEIFKNTYFDEHLQTAASETFSKYGWDNIAQEIYGCNLGPDHI